MVEHCISSTTGRGFNSQRTRILIKKNYSLKPKSFWIKASAKGINVNVGNEARTTVTSANLIIEVEL